MPRKKVEPTQTVDEIVAQAVAARDGNERRRIAAKARNTVIPKKRVGAPPKYSEEKANDICKQVANGKTITSITQAMGITPDCVYHWLKQHPDFSEQYHSARESMARSLADELLDEVKEATPDKALLLKVKGAIIQWAVQRFNLKEFSDSRRLELKAEINHRHTHNLTVDQKRRIAESWLLSQSDKPLIEAQTTGPDLPVQTISDPSPREIPQRKAPAESKRKALEEDF